MNGEEWLTDRLLKRMTDDLTVTTNHKEATMATTDFEVVTVNNIECVDKETAMTIIGLRYATELRNYVQAGRVIVVGQVQVRGKTTKNMFSLASVMKAKETHRTRGSDVPERFEIEIHENVLDAAIQVLYDNKELLDDNYHVITELIGALKKAKNLTEARRQYNAAKKA
jgi:hypothetical protein